jgi:hypothetical protein
MKDGSDSRNLPAGPDRLAPGPQSEESWLKVLVQQPALGISIYLDRITLYANQSYTRLCDYDNPPQIVGTSHLGRVAPECRAQVSDIIRRRKGGEWRSPGSSGMTGPVAMVYSTDFPGNTRIQAAVPFAWERADWIGRPPPQVQKVNTARREC